MSAIVIPINNYDLLSKNLFYYIDFIPDNNLDIINGRYEDYDYFLFKNRFNSKEDLILLTYSKESVIIYLNNFNLSFNLFNQMKNSIQNHILYIFQKIILQQTMSYLFILI